MVGVASYFIHLHMEAISVKLV